MKRKKVKKISTKRKETKKKDKNIVIKEKDEPITKRAGNLDVYKNRFYHQPKALVERIQSTFNSGITKKGKQIVLLGDSILKNLQMGQFGSFIKKIDVYLKVFPGAKVSQLNNHIIHLVEIDTLRCKSHVCRYKRFI